MENTAIYHKDGFAFHYRTEKSGDTDVIAEVIECECYRLRDLKASGLEPKIILDVGAHIGTFSVLAHSLWPEAAIYAFEPNRRSFNLLQLNAPFATCVHGAVRYDEAHLLTDGAGATGGGFMTTPEQFARAAQSKTEQDGFIYSLCEESVTTMTLEAVFAEFELPGADLVKFDCEGSEIDCLQQMRPETARKIRLVLGEYHTEKGFAWFQELAEKTFPHLEFYGGNGQAIGPFWSMPATPPFRRIKLHAEEMYARLYPMRAYSQDGGAFPAVRDANVLLYFPHGFGDWVQVCSILPILEPSNRYWITRFGDDNTALMEGHATVHPLYLGAHSVHSGNGAAYHNENFGLDYDQLDGTERELKLPLPLYEQCIRQNINVFLWCRFPEAFGEAPFPFHTKARHQLPSLVAPETLHQPALHRPLPSSINFAVEGWIARWVESRLKSFAGFGERKLCLIGRNGYTSTGKNWGHLFREDMPVHRRREGEECRDFMRLMLRKDPRWMFLVMEDRLFEGSDTMRGAELQCWSYAELFGAPDTPTLPFGLVLKALMHLAALSVGVPAGPYHLSMAKPELPTVGLWIEHLPSWYDEPKDASIHLLSRNVREQGLDQRPGSFLEQGELRFRGTWLETRIIPGEQVVQAVESLLG